MDDDERRSFEREEIAGLARRYGGRRVYRDGIGAWEFPPWLYSVGCIPPSHALWMGPGSVPRARRRSAFRRHIRHVFVVCPEPEMRRVHAGRIITSGTVVQNEQAVGDCSVMQFPRKAVRVQFAPLATGLHRPIAPIIAMSCPQPAGVGLVDMRPESILPGDRCQAALQRVTAGARTRYLLGTPRPELDSTDSTLAVRQPPMAPGLAGHRAVLAIRMLPIMDGFTAGWAHGSLGEHGEPPIRCAMPGAGANSRPASYCVPIIPDWDTENPHCTPIAGPDTLPLPDCPQPLARHGPIREAGEQERQP